MDDGFFVAQAISLSKACVYVLPARHDQEGAPQVGTNHWMLHPQVACMPLADCSVSRLRRQLLETLLPPEPNRQIVIATS